LFFFCWKEGDKVADIKTKDMKPKTVKTIDKAIAWTEKIKDN